MRQSLREWAFERSAGRCWLCGKPMKPFSYDAGGRMRTANGDPRDTFYAVRLDKAEPETAENVVAMCGSCGSLRAHCANVSELRWVRMRRQKSCTLNPAALRAVLEAGGKAHFTYHYFWFEKPEGKAVIAAAAKTGIHELAHSNRRRPGTRTDSWRLVR
jgi:hypothetical protein